MRRLQRALCMYLKGMWLNAKDFAYCEGKGCCRRVVRAAFGVHRASGHCPGRRCGAFPRNVYDYGKSFDAGPVQPGSYGRHGICEQSEQPLRTNYRRKRSSHGGRAGSHRFAFHECAAHRCRRWNQDALFACFEPNFHPAGSRFMRIAWRCEGGARRPNPCCHELRRLGGQL